MLHFLLLCYAINLDQLTFRACTSDYGGALVIKVCVRECVSVIIEGRVSSRCVCVCV